MERNPTAADDAPQPSEDDDTGVFRVSIGETKFDNCPMQCEFPDFDAFCDAVIREDGYRAKKKGQRFFCSPMAEGEHNEPAKYPGVKTWRLKKHAQGRRYGPFDIDWIDGPDALERLLDFLRPRYKGFAYTTSSHTPDAPRLRVVFAQSRETDYDESIAVCEAVQAEIEKELGAEKIKFDTSVYRGEQPVYLPAEGAKTFRFDGEPLDVDRLLATAPPREKTNRSAPLDDLKATDTTLKMLHALGMVRADLGGGKYSIECLFAAEHTEPGGSSETVYYAAHFNGYAQAHFHCFHNHCANRTDDEFMIAVQQRFAQEKLGTSAAANDAGNQQPAERAPSDAKLAAAQQPESFRFDIRPLTLDDLRNPVPSRRYAIEPLFPLGVFTELVGGHGQGKSMLMLDVEMHIATRRRWCGLPTMGGKVVFASREDDRGEIKRRVQAWIGALPAEERAAAEEDIRDNLIVLGRDETAGLTITTGQYGRCIVHQEAVDLIAERCQGAVMIVLETAARLHGGDEMNEDLAVLAEALERIAGATGAAVVLIRHVSKAGARSKETDSYAGRGGGSLSDAARSVVTLVQLDEAGAKDEGDKIAALVRALGAPVLKLTHAKSSYSAPAAPIHFVRLPGPVLHWITPEAPKTAQQQAQQAQQDGERLLDYIRREYASGSAWTSRQFEKEKYKEAGITSRGAKGLLTKLKEAGDIRLEKIKGHDRWVPVLKN